MSRGDLIGDLRQILHQLPVQMERLYDHILDNLDLKDHAAKYFLLLQAYLGRPDALIFSFSDDVGEDSEFSLKMPREALTDAKLQYRVSEAGKRLNSRCRGLLSLSVGALDFREIMTYSGIGTVQYCHRSAKDYLTLDTVQQKVINMLEAPFDAHLRLCSSHLARWKCCGSDISESERRTIIYKCTEHAKKVAKENSDMMIRVLDDLDPGSDAQSYIDDEHFGSHPWFGGNLLSFAVVLGISEYVKYKVGRGQGCVVRSSSFHLAVDGLEIYPQRPVSPHAHDKKFAEVGRMRDFLWVRRSEKVEWPLLLDALLAAIQPDPEMVYLLLENGADPNLIIRGTGWKKSALHVVSCRLLGLNNRYPLSSGGKRAWVDSMCLLLQRGAKPDRSDIQFLKEFIGEDVISALKLPHIGRHWEFISKHTAPLFGWVRKDWEFFLETRVMEKLYKRWT